MRGAVIAGLWGSEQECAEPPAREDTPGLFAHTHISLQGQVPHAPDRLTILCGDMPLKPLPLKCYSRTPGCLLWDQGPPGSPSVFGVLKAGWGQLRCGGLVIPGWTHHAAPAAPDTVATTLLKELNDVELVVVGTDVGLVQGAVIVLIDL